LAFVGLLLFQYGQLLRFPYFGFYAPFYGLGGPKGSGLGVGRFSFLGSRTGKVPRKRKNRKTGGGKRGGLGFLGLGVSFWVKKIFRGYPGGLGGLGVKKTVKGGGGRLGFPPVTPPVRVKIFGFRVRARFFWVPKRVPENGGGYPGFFTGVYPG